MAVLRDTQHTMLWESRYGGADAASVSPITTQSTGTVQWSVALPVPRATGLVVGADGTCFVTSRETLTAVDAHGKIRWSHTSKYMYAPYLLDTTHVMVYEEQGVTVYDQLTGTEIAVFPSKFQTKPIRTPDGALIYVAIDDDQLMFHRRTLSGTNQAWAVVDLATSGNFIWTEAAPTIRSPLMFERQILLVVRGRLHAYDDDGRLCWWADRHVVSSGPLPVDAADCKILTSLIQIDRSRILVGMGWNEGSGFFIVDVLQQRVDPLPIHLPVKEPIALPSLPGYGTCMALQGWPEGDNIKGTSREKIVVIDLAGNLLWQHTMARAPHTIVADATGKIIIASSPSQAYWDTYQPWIHQEKSCVVQCFSPTGEVCWRWQAPGPISPVLAIGHEGVIHVVADGSLWAIG